MPEVLGGRAAVSFGGLLLRVKETEVFLDAVAMEPCAPSFACGVPANTFQAAGVVDSKFSICVVLGSSG